MMVNNLTLMTDLYQLTMMQGYFEANMHNKKAVFDMFYRKNPSNNGYAIVCGLEQIVDYIKNIKFDEDNINYLKSLNIFKDDFLQYLKEFKFTGDIYAIPEGTIVFPNEPLIRVSSNIMEAQFIETTILNIINHQSLIATKASRVAWAAEGDFIMEFGLRRAQGPDAGVYGSRAAFIGGCMATSNVLAGKMFNIPVSGTHSHSWVMSFKDEITAFRTYANIFPDRCILLVDTYDTLKSGVPNAIKVFKEMEEKGVKLKSYGIRLDSGDLAYISDKARTMLDEAGFKDAIITASNDLDENIISSLKQQGTKINVWGVGTNLITSSDCPAFGGVYKLCAEEVDGEVIPKIKLSENTDKVNNPGVKKIFRIYDKATNKVKADLICLEDENIDENEDLTIFHPINTWKTMTLKANEYYTKELLKPVFLNGKCVFEKIETVDIKKHCENEKESFWNEYKRLINPHILPVDLSLKLYNLKKDMIDSIRRNK
ncbi:nicotinate phosphoribosyltransferase [[Clostridium] colinum]|uniref:nicotinate phosphoribosyltransferase n=1 Tax=[Clostridium] colinum TaxID=36835 RepID=UPI002024CD9D|nr:nicotinate phosphoribosyltransferase [[Clostridium] colinum]